MPKKRKKHHRHKRKKLAKSKFSLRDNLNSKVDITNPQATKYKQQTISNRSQPTNTQPLTRSTLDSLWQYLLLVFVTLGVLFSFAWIYRTYTADKDYKLGKAYVQANKYQTGFSLMERSIRKAPKEALFYSDLSLDQAKLALVFAQQKQLNQASQAAQIALETSNRVIQLNPWQLNFYKTRARTLSLLAATYEVMAKIDQDHRSSWQAQSRKMLKLADETLERARRLAPNEPSITFDQAKIKNALGETNAARALFEATLKLKPDYPEALWVYGRFLKNQSDYQRAKEIYQQYLDLVDSNNPKVKQKLKEVNDLLATQSGKIGSR